MLDLTLLFTYFVDGLCLAVLLCFDLGFELCGLPCWCVWLWVVVLAGCLVGLLVFKLIYFVLRLFAFELMAYSVVCFDDLVCVFYLLWFSSA